MKIEVTDLKAPPQPEAPTCRVCKKPMVLRLKPDWKQLVMAMPAMFSGRAAALMAYEVVDHTDCEEQAKQAQRDAELEAARERAQGQKTSELTNWHVIHRLPHDFKNKTFEKFSIDEDNRDAFELVKAWRTSDEFGLLIMGPAGTGKSHLGFAAVNRVISEYEAAPIEFVQTDPFGIGIVRFEAKRCAIELPAYASVADVLANARTGGNDVSRLEHHGLLFLDDIGAENLTDWSREIFFRVFEYRLNKKLPTILTTNLSLNELKERLHERVVSRILGMCVPITLKGKDRRKDLMLGQAKMLRERTRNP